MKVWNIINTIGLIVFSILLVACIVVLVLNITIGF